MANQFFSSVAEETTPIRHFAGSLCQKNVVCVSKDTLVSEAAKLMRDHHIGDVVVVEERGGRSLPIGIVTDRDLTLEVLCETSDSGGIAVADVMVRSLAVAEEKDDMAQLIKIMKEQGVARLPIVDEAGELVGIVTARKLLQVLTQELTAVLSIAEKQQEREKELRH